jgi:hypothetical protein
VVRLPSHNFPITVAVSLRTLALRTPIEQRFMNLTSTSWSVAATVRAPEVHVNLFLSHYLSLGAERIFIHFDDPLQQCFDHAIGDGRMTPFTCDSQYWSERGIARPDNLNDRQLTNLAHAARLNRSEWLLHVDCDELLASTRNIDEILSEHHDDRVFSLRLEPMEAVYTAAPTVPFATTYFRRALRSNRDSEALLAQIYGDLAPLCRFGLFGHRAGKSFLRMGRVIESWNCHRAVPQDKRLVVDVKEPRIELLHFDAMEFKFWREKFLRRISGEVAAGMSKVRLDQIRKIRETADSEGEPGLFRLYSRMHVMSVDKLNLAIASGFVVTRLWDRRLASPAIREG